MGIIEHVILYTLDSGHSTIREGNENDLDDAFLNDAETMHRVLSEKRRRSNQQPLVEVCDALVLLDMQDAKQNQMKYLSAVRFAYYRKVVNIYKTYA